MRLEPYSVDSIVHVTKRGVREMDIVRDDEDRWRSTRSLLLLNDTYTDPNWHREAAKLPAFERPSHWPEREPLVRILAWTLLSNHFHLLLQEIRKGGTAKFMQRIGGSMSMCFNLKYEEKGSIFQGAYHGRVVERGEHLNYLAFYILVKNVLEMYPGGLRAALVNFDDAWEWACRYPFSSLPGLIFENPIPIVDDAEGLMAEVIGSGDSFKGEARELLEAHMASRGEDFKSIMLEPW
ncbi:transposase [Candidatus Kaiserbacteria bacterium]|nr:transposase [Candidatus Kaiserbacteria bacterium]